MIIDRIARETGVTPAIIETIINTASRRYKTYRIRKRTEGFREINHPTPVIKFLQRWIVRNFISHLPVHPSVMSYREGVGVSKNAKMHVAQNYLLKMDFQNFFPSIKGGDVRNLILANIRNPSFVELNEQDVDVIVKIACKNNELTIGAPSSPSISNAVLYGFDEFISNESASRGIVYSRYADDISFSTNVPNLLSEIHGMVKKRLEEQKSPCLTINSEKTAFTSRKHRRSVSGLILTSEKKISIGRDKKREVKALCHQFRKGDLPAEKASYLRGYLSYVNSVEPSFIESLRRKFGVELMQRILGMPLVSRK